MIEQLLQADRLLKVDQVDAAESIYGHVAELDPRNAMAVVGLARCALAKGDDRRAHALASRALGIDPQDDMARRMEARLAEILTVRGDRVERPAAAGGPSPREMRPVVAGAPERPAGPTDERAGRGTTEEGSEPARRRGILARLRGR